MTTPLYDQVYAEYIDKVRDPVWKFAMEVFLGELMQQNATYHQAQIQSIADWAAERQLNRYKTSITKRYLIDRLVEVRKDGGSATAEADHFKEGWWSRDDKGRFASYHGPEEKKNTFWRRPDGSEISPRHRGTQGDNVRAVVAQELARKSPEEREAEYNLRGLLAHPQELPDKVSQTQHAVDVSNLFDKLTWNLANKTGDTRDKQRVQFIISSPDGYHRVETPKPGVMPSVRYDEGERVQFMTPVGADNPVTIAGKAVNIGHVAGVDPELAAKGSAVMQDMNNAMNTPSWGQRLQHTANALRVVTDNHPVATQAHAVASLFNILGPSANRAFGNKLKQLAYRYRGQEASPDNYSPVAKEGRQVYSDGTMQSTRDYEKQLSFDLAKSIPSSSQFNLAMQSGGTPPSRGYILNADGRVVSEAVGYADDWYAPFNLRKLPQMRGGSYVRTRAYGGLTPEDIRIAMRTGVKRATVISNNGTFTMEFQPKALHWGHRFGFAGNGMIRRYAKALDALHNQAVNSPDGANQKMKLDTEGYIAAMRDLQLKNPYYIRPESEAHKYHQSLREFGNIDRAEVIGEGAIDNSYLSPTDIHARNAVAGWHSPHLRDLWSTDQQGNATAYKWSDVSQAQLHHDHAMGLVNQLRRDERPESFGPGASSASNGSGSGGSAQPKSVSEGWFKIDDQGLRRNHKGRLIDENGREYTGNGSVQSAVLLRNKLQRDENTRHLTRPGFVAEIGSKVSRVGEAAQDPKAAEQTEKSHHLDADTAQALAEKTKLVLQRTQAKGLLPEDTSGLPHLDRARKALHAGSNSEEYKSLVHDLATSATYRGNLGTDIKDLLDGQGVDEDGELQVSTAGLLAQLGDSYSRISPKVDQQVAEHVSSGALLHGDPEYVMPPQDLEHSAYLQRHVSDLAGRAEGGDERAAKEHAEWLTYKAMHRKITAARKQQEASGHSPGSIDRLLRSHSDEERAFFKQQNQKFGAMVKHGEEHLNAGSDSGARTTTQGETTTIHLKAQAVIQGHSAEQVAQTHYDELYGQGLRGEKLKANLGLLSNAYANAASRAYKSGSPDVRNRAKVYEEVGYQLDRYKEGM